MNIIQPILASQHAADYRQAWHLAGIWRRSINLCSPSGELLTLHRRGSGVGPGGWVLRCQDFDALREALDGNERPQVAADGVRLGAFTLRIPRKYCSLRLTPHAQPSYLAAHSVMQGEETGMFGLLGQAVSAPLDAELLHYQRHFAAALAGECVDWRPWLGKGPGLTPSHDDTLTGMMLAGWYFGALKPAIARRFFAASGNLAEVTTTVSVSYLRYAAEGCFASPLLHFTHGLGRSHRASEATEALLGLGHTSGADTLLGFWLGQQIIKG